MKLSDKTQKECSALIERLQLPDDFHRIVSHVYAALAQIIIDRAGDNPILVSVNGAQGTGKSTLVLFLRHILESELACATAVLSIDDFYYTRETRERLAVEEHPLLITRGVPGTHDIGLIEQALDNLISRRICRVPRFDKAADDRHHENNWTVYTKPVEVILFEGWCNNSPVQSTGQLEQPVNDLERNEDANGSWRYYVNEKLKEYHRRAFDRSDMCIMLKAPAFEVVYDWRMLQEEKLKSQSGGFKQPHIMNEAELKRFVQHFERISRHTLNILPDIADIVIPINRDHSIIDVIRNNTQG